MTVSQALTWASAHPEALAAAVVAVRALYALASRLVAPYPRARAVVEALAALGPDVLRAGRDLRPGPPADLLGSRSGSRARGSDSNRPESRSRRPPRSLESF